MIDLAALDLRWLTAGCQIGMGMFFVLLAVRVWWMTPEERAPLFGPYLTEKGLRFVLRAWPLVFIGGLFLVVTGVSKWAYYERWQGSLGTPIANGIGLLEAIFAIWAAVSLAIVIIRTWRGDGRGFF